MEFASDAAQDLLECHEPTSSKTLLIEDVFDPKDGRLQRFLNAATSTTQTMPVGLRRHVDQSYIIVRGRRLRSVDGEVRILLRLEANSKLSRRFRILAEGIQAAQAEIAARKEAENQLAKQSVIVQNTLAYVRQLAEIDTSKDVYLLGALETLVAACGCHGGAILGPISGSMQIIEAHGDLRKALTSKASGEIVGGDAVVNINADPERDIIEPARAALAARTDCPGDTEGWLCYPLTESGNPMAVLILSHGTAEAPGEHTMRQLEILCQTLGTLMVRARAEGKYRHAARLHAIGELTGGVAHDFNNILAIILGNAELLQELLFDSPDAEELADEIAEAAQRGATLTSQLLAFARKQPLNPKVMRVDAIVRDIDPLLRRIIDADIAIERVGCAGLWYTRVDHNQLENALLNLVVNARDAMPGGGKITIETANMHLDRHYTARQSELTPGQYVMLAVSDTGHGMSPDIMREAFDPFFTTKDVGQGSGLGLSMVFGFAKQSGGHVMLYSEPGLGTTVKLYFPRHHAKVDGRSTAQIVEKLAPKGSGRILLVEDDPALLRYAERTLRSLGYDVHSALNGDEAKSIADVEQFDLLLTDVVLPGKLNGAQLADQLSRDNPPLKVIFMSGYTKNAIVHNGHIDPGVELLMKPFTKADLAERLKAVLNGDR